MAKYKSKLKRNSKYNPKSERFKKHATYRALEYIQTCKNKNVYPTLNTARQAKKSIEDRGKNVSIYKCPNCKKYHLTSE